MLLAKRQENLEEVKKDVDLKVQSYSIEVKEKLIFEINGLQDIISSMKTALDNIRNEFKSKKEELYKDFEIAKAELKEKIKPLIIEVQELEQRKQSALKPIHDEIFKLDDYKKNIVEYENRVIEEGSIIRNRENKVSNREESINLKEIFLNEKEIKIATEENVIKGAFYKFQYEYNAFIIEKNEFNAGKKALFDDCEGKLKEARELNQVTENLASQNIIDRREIEKDRLHLQSQIDNFNKHGKFKSR